MEDVPTATVMEVTTMAGEMNGIIMEEMMIGKAADQTIILPVIKPQLK